MKEVNPVGCKEIGSRRAIRSPVDTRLNVSAMICLDRWSSTTKPGLSAGCLINKTPQVFYLLGSAHALIFLKKNLKVFSAFCGSSIYARIKNTPHKEGYLKIGLRRN